MYTTVFVSASCRVFMQVQVNRYLNRYWTAIWRDAETSSCPQFVKEMCLVECLAFVLQSPATGPIPSLKSQIMYVHTYICMYVWIYIYIYTHTYMYTTVFVSASCRVFIHRNQKKNTELQPQLLSTLASWDGHVGVSPTFHTETSKKSCLYTYIYIISIYIYLIV